MNFIKHTTSISFNGMNGMEALGKKEQEPTWKWHQNTSVGEVERHEDSVSETGSPATHHLTGSRTFNNKIMGYKLRIQIIAARD